MASTADAQVILELYKLRQEEGLRKARNFMGFEFWPKDLEELRAVSRAPGSDKNAYWRQVITYWEMAASLVLRGAVDADLCFWTLRARDCFCTRSSTTGMRRRRRKAATCS